MKYILKTNKLLINPEQSAHSAFIYTGSPNEGQKDKGKLIVLLDFPEKTENPKELGNLLIQKIHKLYYHSTLVEQEAILENILEEVNENLPLITEIDNTWTRKFNAVIAIIYRQEVYFSPLGNISAWTTNDKKLINIFDYLESDIDKPTVNKVFTNILSGNIEPNQLLFFTTNSIFNYLSKDKIKKIVVSNEPAGIILKFKELLNKVKNKTFCLVSIKLSPYTTKKEKTNTPKSSESPNKKPSKKSNGININISPQESIDKLLQSQKATEEILNKGKSSIKEKEIKLPVIETETPSAPLIKEEKFKEKNKTKNNYIFFKWFSESLKLYIEILFKIVKTIIDFCKNFVQNISQKKSAKKNLSKILNSPKNPTLEKKITPPTPLSPRATKKITGSRNIIIVALILLIAFAGSILLMNNKKRLAQEKENYEKILKNIDEKQEEYDLLLIYNNSGEAKDKLEEISDLINQLPQRTEEQISKYNEILDKFTETLNQTRKLNTIKDPEIIAELNFTPAKIVKYGNNLIALGNNSNNLSSLDLKTKELNNISSSEISYDNITNFSKDGDFIYGLENNDQVLKIDLENKTASETTITYHPNYNQADDLMVYGSRIYILDSQNNQIYKHNQGSNVFGKGEEWIQDGTDIKDAQALTIDGNIYIATNIGEIKKLYTGNLETFTTEEIDPEIKNINKIFTDTSINEIYLMDNNSKRIIIIDKDGNLVNQFYLPTLSVMNDFIIDGAAQKVYIQSDNKIISLDLN